MKLLREMKADDIDAVVAIIDAHDDDDEEEAEHDYREVGSFYDQFVLEQEGKVIGSSSTVCQCCSRCLKLVSISFPSIPAQPLLRLTASPASARLPSVKTSSRLTSFVTASASLFSSWLATCSWLPLRIHPDWLPYQQRNCV